MIIVTIPLGVTRAVILSPIPVLVLETPVVTDPVIPLAVELDSVGTVVPTLMDAGILSVAMTAGAERTLALLSDSINDTVPRSSRLLPTSMAADRPMPPPVSPDIREAAVFATDPVAFNDCSEAVMSL